MFYISSPLFVINPELDSELKESAGSPGCKRRRMHRSSEGNIVRLMVETDRFESEVGYGGHDTQSSILSVAGMLFTGCYNFWRCCLSVSVSV